jgi:hypothetical protein
METKMQTSFIPKKPITESRLDGGGISLFLLLSIIVFIVSLALVGGVWVWQKKLAKQIEDDKQALVQAKESYEEDTINPLIRLNDRMKESQTLLNNHIAVSPIFKMLEINVLRNVRLKTMNFNYADGGKIKVSLVGTAASYEVLSKQADAFGSESLRKFISQPVISDFNPTIDGKVDFNFSAIVDPGLVSYEGTLNSGEVVIPADSNNATSSIPNNP